MQCQRRHHCKGELGQDFKMITGQTMQIPREQCRRLRQERARSSQGTARSKTELDLGGDL